MSSRRSKLSPEQQAKLRERLRGLQGNERTIPRRASTGPAPLSFAQRPLWFIERMDPTQAAYNMPTAYRIRGPLDAERLERALNEVVARHEAWRLTMPADDAVQVAAPEQFVPLERVDTRDPRGFVDAEARRPFDLAKGPLVRAHLLRVGADDHVLLVCTHHVVSDGWSVSVFHRELAACYAGEALPELPLQYTDYAEWQRERIDAGALDADLAYWRDQLAAAPVLEIPTDHPRPATQTFSGAKRRFVLPADLTARLRAFSRAENVSLFMTLLGAFNVLLHRYARQDDITVGFPIANRNHVELEGLLGCFVNTLVLRSDVADDPSFRDYLQRVKRTCLDAYAHQEVPFAKLVDTLNPVREQSRNPLFSEAFSYVNEMLAPPRLQDLDVETFDIDGGTCMFDSTLLLAENGDEIAGFFEYNTDLFDEATIDRRIAHYRVLLEGILDDASRPVSRLPLLTEDERRTVVTEWNRSGATFPGDDCIHRLFERQVDKTPDRPALTYEGESITYRELDERANRVAHHLRQQGVGPEALVGLHMERTPDLVAGILGILKAGGAYVPMDPAYPQERLDHMVADAKLQVVLTDLDGIGEQPAHRPECTAGPGNAAYVIYTSGSTGKPKGCVIEHRNVVRLFSATQPWYSFDENDVWTLFHSSAFDFSVWEIWGALIHGGRLVVVPYFVSRSPDSFCELLRREKVTVLNQTPSAFLELTRTDTSGLSLRTVIFGGEALDLESLRPWFDRHGDESPRLVNMYGITETTVHVTYRPVSLADLDARTGSVIGRPIPDLQLYLLDRHMEPVPIGVPGEIHVGGAGVSRGYLDRDALTAERFVPDPFGDGRLYRTGDLARFKGNGDVEYLGRIDDQVKLRGFRIELGEIEAALTEQPGVSQAIVLKRDDQLVAWVVGSAAPDGLRAALKRRLPQYMVPSAFVALDELPLTPNGKIDRAALPAPDTQRRELRAELVEAGTALEKDLAGIWQDALGMERVGVEDNFFDLGGHSLLMVSVQTALQDHLGRPVSIVDLFRYPTIRSLAAFLQGTESSPGDDDIDDRVRKQKAARARRRKARDV